MMSKQKSIWKRTAIRQAIQRLMFEEDGAVLVEATLIAPILVVMSVYVMDFGLSFYYKMEMQNAAQAGAQWAIANGVYNSSSIQVAAQNATQLPAAGTSACTATSPPCVTVTSSQFCGCSNDSSGHAVVTLLSSTGCTVAPNSTCNSTGVAGNYVTVSASPTNTYHSFVPPIYGLMSSTPNISATTTVRIQ
jgi:Flp pilus assembly protein TadG